MNNRFSSILTSRPVGPSSGNTLLWMSGRPWSIQTKMAVGIGLLGAVTGGICALAIWTIGLSEIDGRIKKESISQTELIISLALDSIISQDRPALHTVVSGLRESQLGLVGIAIESEFGSTLANWERPGAVYRGVTTQSPIILHDQKFGVVSLTWDRSYFAQPIRDEIQDTLLAIAFTTLLTIVASTTWVHLFIVRPLRLLENRVKSVGVKGQSVSISNLLRTREFESLTQSLDQFSSILTERSERERELAAERVRAEEAERLAKAKMEFLSLMSHEIRTPLGAVIGFTDLLTPTNLDAKQRSYVDHINESGNFLLQVTNEILDLSKIEADGITLEYEAFKISHLFDQLVSMLRPKAEEQQIEILTKRTGLPGDIEILADRHRLKQILLNLASNAIKFTSRGSVTLEYELTHSETKNRCIAKFAVTDTGIGMCEEQTESIFNPFSQADQTITRRFGGTGLGLSIAQGLVEKMGGKIEVASQIDAGSSFSFELEFDYETVNRSLSPSKVPVTPLATHDRGSLKPLKILVAEDAAVNRILIEKLLGTFGQDPDFAENGQVAVEMLEAEENYDLVLLDLRMPLKTGLEVAKLIRGGSLGEHYQNIPIAMLSADVMAIEESRDYGVDEFITKPIDPESLRKFLGATRGPIDSSSVELAA